MASCECCYTVAKVFLVVIAVLLRCSNLLFRVLLETASVAMQLLRCSKWLECFYGVLGGYKCCYAGCSRVLLEAVSIALWFLSGC